MEKFSRRVLEICKQYNLPLIPELKISNKMIKNAGNIRIYGVYGNINKVVITISNHLLKQFGEGRAYKTLNHELAHYVDFMKTGKLSHGKSFINICEKLGGSVNSYMAAKYRGTNVISESRYPDVKKYKYTCSCGYSFTKSYMMRKTAHTSFCRCGKRVSFMKVEKIS